MIFSLSGGFNSKDCRYDATLVPVIWSGLAIIYCMFCLCSTLHIFTAYDEIPLRIEITCPMELLNMFIAHSLVLNGS